MHPDDALTLALEATVSDLRTLLARVTGYLDYQGDRHSAEFSAEIERAKAEVLRRLGRARDAHREWLFRPTYTALYVSAPAEAEALWQEPALANVGLDEDAAAWDAEIAEHPCAGYETFDGSALQQEMSRA